MLYPILYTVAGVDAVFVVRVAWLDARRARALKRSRQHGRYVR